MQPFNFLKIGYQGPFQYQPLPTPGPGAFSGAANALGTASGSLGQFSSAMIQRQQQQRLMQMYLDQMHQSVSPNPTASQVDSMMNGPNTPLPATAYTGTSDFGGGLGYGGSGTPLPADWGGSGGLF